MGDEGDQADLLQRYGCTVEHRRIVLDHMIAARKAGRLLVDPSRVADSGIVRIKELRTCRRGAYNLHNSCTVLMVKFIGADPAILKVGGGGGPGNSR